MTPQDGGRGPGNGSSSEGEKLPEPSFQLLVTQLGAQARIELGDIPNPMSGETQVSLERAKFTIDMLQMLKDRTQGNLSQEEGGFLDSVLYELRMSYVKRRQEGQG